VQVTVDTPRFIAVERIANCTLFWKQEINLKKREIWNSQTQENSFDLLI
jgi:hypothetical protein